MLQERAKEKALELGISFPCSNGWLDNFKRRNGIKNLDRLPDTLTRWEEDEMVGHVLEIKEDEDVPVWEEEVSHGYPVTIEDEDTSDEVEVPEQQEDDGEEEVQVVEEVLESFSRQCEESESPVHEVEEQAPSPGVPVQYSRFMEYTREEALDAYQVLSSYFKTHPPPPGTLLSMKRIREALGPAPAHGTLILHEDVYNMDECYTRDRAS